MEREVTRRELMRSFTHEEKSQVSEALRSHGVGPQVVRPFPAVRCPVCREGKVLRYRYRRPRGSSGNALFGYIWCSHCMRYAGFMGAVPEWWSLDDVLTEADHEQFERDGIGGLEQMLKHVETLEGALG